MYRADGLNYDQVECILRPWVKVVITLCLLWSLAVGIWLVRIEQRLDKIESKMEVLD